MKQLSLIEGFSTSLSTHSLNDLMSENIPYDAAETLLEEYLQEELSEFEMLDVKMDTVSDINCKWRYSSALQKSIRRGYVLDSIRYALTYHSVDPAGFWGRLIVIVFEDAGVGDALVVANTLAVARSKTFRHKLGGDIKTIHYIIKKLTESVKDRTVADLCQVLENRPQSPEVLTALKSATLQELSDIALSDQNSFNFRIAASWMLWGDKLKNGRLPLRTGSRDVFDYTIEKTKIPGLVKYVTMRGMVACRSAMNLVYPFVWEMMNKSSYVKVIETSFPAERGYIKGLPPEAFDKHTREGKTAYQYFYKVCPAVNNFLTSRSIVGSDEIISAIGISVFICESALLGKKIDFNGAGTIYKMTVEDDYRKNGLTLDDGRELSKLIQDNADFLRQARIQAVAGKRV